ncbi:MAG: N4-gp56 family major capsid protein [Nitrospinota bacterium]
MAQFQWQFDAPTGVFKQHALSRKLYEAAVAKSVFMDHVAPVEGFGRKRGELVTLTRISNLAEPTSGKLTEGERIPEDAFAITTVNITVSEYGRAVPYTSLSDDLSFFNLENQIQRTLRDQMALTMDTAAAAAYKNAKVKYAITGLTANNITTNGTFGASSSENMNMWHVEEIRDYMFDTLFVPPAEGDDYVAIFRTLGLRGIKRDPAWEEWHKYTDPQAKFNAEMGRMEGIRFIETNHSNALGKVGTSSVLGEGVVFGADSVALAEVLTPELRAAIPADFGRSKAVAWYGILELGLIWDTGNAGQARVLHVGST